MPIVFLNILRGVFFSLYVFLPVNNGRENQCACLFFFIDILLYVRPFMKFVSDYHSKTNVPKAYAQNNNPNPAPFQNNNSAQSILLA